MTRLINTAKVLIGIKKKIDIRANNVRSIIMTVNKLANRVRTLALDLMAVLENELVAG